MANWLSQPDRMGKRGDTRTAALSQGVSDQLAATGLTGGINNLVDIGLLLHNLGKNTDQDSYLSALAGLMPDVLSQPVQTPASTNTLRGSAPRPSKGFTDDWVNPHDIPLTSEWTMDQTGLPFEEYSPESGLAPWQMAGRIAGGVTPTPSSLKALQLAGRAVGKGAKSAGSTALTNYRPGPQPGTMAAQYGKWVDDAPNQGGLPYSYLESPITPEEYAELVDEVLHPYDISAPPGMDAEKGFSLTPPLSRRPSIRTLYDPVTGKHYAWDANAATHDITAQNAGIAARDDFRLPAGQRLLHGMAEDVADPGDKGQVYWYDGVGYKSPEESFGEAIPNEKVNFLSGGRDVPDEGMDLLHDFRQDLPSTEGQIGASNSLSDGPISNKGAIGRQRGAASGSNPRTINSLRSVKVKAAYPNEPVTAALYPGNKEIDVLVNPSAEDVRRFAQEAPQMRVAVGGEDNTFYVWDAADAIHVQAQNALGADFSGAKEFSDRFYAVDDVVDISEKIRRGESTAALNSRPFGFNDPRKVERIKFDSQTGIEAEGAVPARTAPTNSLADQPISNAGPRNRQRGAADGSAFAPTRTDKSRHGKKTKSGSTVGAPPQIKNKRQLNAWRERRLASIEKGAPHADWYERNSKFLDTITAGNNEQATALARAGSSVSNNTTPASELSYTARGSNQLATGDPLRTGKMPNQMSPRFEEAMLGQGQGGLKTDPYALHKMVEWDKAQVTRPTNDVWMVREFEYPKEMQSAGSAQHRWMDEQMEWLRDEANRRGLGGKTDWNYGTVQAAPWVYKKGAEEFAAAKNKLGDEQFYIDRAAKDWWETSPDYTAQVTREWTPGRTTKHMPEMLEAAPEVRDEYGDLLEGLVTDDVYGTDRIAREMGALTLPSERSIGRYKDLEGIQQLNPGYNTNMLVGKRYVSGDSIEHGGAPGMDDSSAKLADAIASAHGLIGTQDQVARRYMTETAGSTGAPQVRAGAIEFLRDEPFSPAEMKALQDDAMAVGLDPPAKSTRGANSLVFADEGALERKEMNKAANALAEKYGARRRWSHADTDLYPVDKNFNAPRNWSAQPFIDRIKAGGDTVTEGFESVMRDIAPGMRKEVKKFAKANKMTEAQWYGKMMDILSKPNAIKNLEKAVKDGIVPVAFLGVLGFEEEMSS